MLNLFSSSIWGDTVQVAQYGLSHYSKNLSDRTPKRKILEDGNLVTAKWQVPKGASVKRNYDYEKFTHVLEFNSHGKFFQHVEIIYFTSISSIPFFPM